MTRNQKKIHSIEILYKFQISWSYAASVLM